MLGGRVLGGTLPSFDAGVQDDSHLCELCVQSVCLLVLAHGLVVRSPLEKVANLRGVEVRGEGVDV